MSDIGGQIHREIYGHSDKVNALENQSEEFQAGFVVGRDGHQEDGIGILAEYLKRGQPVVKTMEFRNFTEWKRGFWAARIQRSLSIAIAKAKGSR